MTRYLGKEPFSSKPSTDSYRKGWEWTFKSGHRIKFTEDTGEPYRSSPAAALYVPKPKKRRRKR